MSNGIVTFDLDSTLCDTGHRHVLVNREGPTDWEAYSRACANDGLIEASAALLRIFYAAGIEVHFVTGRSLTSRDLTRQWLDKYVPGYAGLWMDESTDHVIQYGSHAAYKVARVKEVEARTGKKVLLHVDDWADVKVALEEAGVPCLCVRTPQEIEELVRLMGRKAV